MPTPPAASHVTAPRRHHGDEVDDPFSWLAERENSHVVAHLEAENAYADAVTADLAGLREQIFEEIRSRTKESDLSVPVAYRGWWYYTRTIEGSQYPLHCRVPAGEAGRPDVEAGPPPGEQVVVDGNLEAGEGAYFALGASEVDPAGERVAFAVDVEGDERFALTVRDIATGVVVDDAVGDIGYGVVWSGDGRHLFYTRVDEAWRPHEVWRHEVGTPAENDVLVHREPDERFWMGIGSSRDDRWLVIGVSSKSTSEGLLLDLDDPLAEPRLVAPRREGVEYHVEPAGDRLLVVHNANRPDFEVSWAPLDATDPAQWMPWLTPAAGERIVDVDAFADHVAVSLRTDGLTAVCLVTRDPSSESGVGAVRDLPVDEELYSIALDANPEWDCDTVRFVYESFVTPRTVAEYDLTTGRTEVLKRRAVLGVDLTDYVQRREWVTARDGTQVPCSIVHRRGLEPDGTGAATVYGYGAYELSMDPAFSVARLSYLDRGVVLVVAHVRGGGEMGRSWYEGGRLEHKANTFTDLVDCAAHVVRSGWAHPQRLGVEGGSAGGLLVGAAINLAPELFRVALAAVPFVDALTTMLDPSLPLTVTEWEEWGDPLHDAEVYARMKAYSPYENVRATEYPAVLATTSLNDTRVSYAEPAKWVARLRETVTQDQTQRPILLRTEMVAGHGGRSGRYDSWHEFAWEAAFVLDQLDAKARL